MDKNQVGPSTHSINEYIRYLNPENTHQTSGETIHQFAIFQRESEEASCKALSQHHRRNFYKISYVLSGKGSFKINDREFDIQSGTLIVSKPGAVMSWDLAPNGQTGLYTLFSEDFYDIGLLPAYRIENVLHLENGFCFLAEASPRAFQHTFQQLYDNKHNLEFARHYLRLLVARISQFNNTAKHEFQNGGETIVNAFQSLIRDRLEQPSNNDNNADLFSVKNYADHLHIDDNYLNILCKTVTGKTPSFIIKEKVLAEAKFLLLGSTLSISEIADRLGFYDTAHFSNWFKKNTQSSPSAYRTPSNYK